MAEIRLSMAYDVPPTANIEPDAGTGAALAVAEAPPA